MLARLNRRQAHDYANAREAGVDGCENSFYAAGRGSSLDSNCEHALPRLVLLAELSRLIQRKALAAACAPSIAIAQEHFRRRSSSLAGFRPCFVRAPAKLHHPNSLSKQLQFHYSSRCLCRARMFPELARNQQQRIE